MKHKLPKPPVFHSRLFRWFCKSEIYDELQGDLEEEFLFNMEQSGLTKARQLYRKEVIKMIRPSVVDKPKKLRKLIMPSLLRMNLKLALRNMVKHKAFSAINIFGLALALCVSMFIANMIYTGFSFDKQHADLDRIHRIVNTVIQGDSDQDLYASMPYPAILQLKSDIPDFEAITHLKRDLIGTFRLNDEDVLIRGFKVDSAFFDIFNFQVISGNPLAIFSDINSIIITENVAERYFPGENAIGKQTKEGLVVRAILESPKRKSHLQFDVLGRLEALHSNAGTTQRNEHGWSNYQSDYAYVKLQESSSASLLNTKLEIFSDKVNSTTGFEKVQYEFSSQPMKGLIYGEPCFNEPGFIVGKEGLYTYVIMMAVMLFIASFNYTNLSVSRAIQRTKEIGIRKVSGSTKGQIMGQILWETLILSFVSLLIGLGIYSMFSDDFILMMPFFAQVFNPHLDFEIIVLFSLFTFITGLVAGIFPAIFFSNISPLSLFNPRVKSKKLSFMTIRKVLVTFQLTLSMFCILFIILIQQQASLLKDRPKGFETESRMIIRTDSEKATLLKTAMLGVSGVDAITIASDVPGDIMNGAVRFFDPVNNDTTLMTYALTVDASFHEVMAPKLIDGRFFSKDIVEGTQQEVLVNEEFLQLIKMDVATAIGTVLSNNKQQFKIIGVLQSMISHVPFLGPTKPFMVIAGKPASNTLLLVKLNTANTDTPTAGLETAWKGIYPDNKFKPEPLEAYLQKPMIEFQNLISAQNFIAFTIIAIALLGQLGMAMYNAETRIKEISVRKVLGARISSIIRLLLRGTIIPLIIASLIACPIAFLLFKDIISISMSNPLTPSIGHFSAGIGLLATVAVAVVISQTWRVAVLNPTHILRSE